MDFWNIFSGDAFSMVSLTDRVNKMPFAPGRAGRLGIFQEEGIATTYVAIEELSGLLTLIPTTPRGAAPIENAHNKAKLRYLTVPHLDLWDAVMPDEVQNTRMFGGGTQLASVQAVVDGRLREMIAKHDATVEYGRVGAIKGTILDADGSTVLFNLFTEFGVTQTSVDFVLGTTTTSMMDKVISVKDAIEDELGSATYDHIHCFAGKTWFSKFAGHEAVATAYERWQNGEYFRTDKRYEGFDFAGVVFEQYRGNVGGIGFIPDSEAYFFPVGVPGLFRTYYAPADWVETVNTIGLPRYSKQWVDPDGGKYVRVATQSNPLSICTRPKVLVKGTTSN